MLIKYGCAEHAANRTHDLSGLVAFFVVYNFITTRVVNVFENNSEVIVEEEEEQEEEEEEKKKRRRNRSVERFGSPSCLAAGAVPVHVARMLVQTLVYRCYFGFA